jgi:hypothetical protein
MWLCCSIAIHVSTGRSGYSSLCCRFAFLQLLYVVYRYRLILLHSGQNVVPLLVSKAQVSSFCLELSKKLDMRYKSPPLPVDLSMVQRTAGTHEDQDSGVAKLAGLNADSESIKNIEAMFEMKA